MKAYADALLRYFSFSGRSSRSQYWVFQLVVLLLTIVAIELDVLLAGQPGLITIGVIVFHMMPQLTLAVRRLHDIGKSGLWWLVAFLPFGSLVLLYWHCQPSEMGSNDYGDDPTQTPPPAEPEYVPASGIARVANLSRPAPAAAPRQAIARPQPPTFGMRGRTLG